MRARAGLLLVVACLTTLVACGSPAPSPIAVGFVCSNWAITSGDAVDVVVDLGQAQKLEQTVDIRVGQILAVGGGRSCPASWSFPPAAHVRPTLEEVSRVHTNPTPGFVGGDGEIRYRALHTGSLRIPLCAGTCIPRSVTVTVIPAEAPADAARSGTGTITLTGGPLAGTHPFSDFSCRLSVEDGVGHLPTPPYSPAESFTFTAEGRRYEAVLGPLTHLIGQQSIRRARDHDLTIGPWTSPAAGYELYDPAVPYPDISPSSPRFGTMTIGDQGGTLTTTPLYADDVHHDIGTVALEWHC